MSKVIEFPADRIVKGVHMYMPELDERKVNAQIEASLSHYGNHYFLYTSLELKGRGIVQQETSRPGLNSYKVTINAFEKIKQQYSISMSRYLD
ncbi:hypothetical protein [Paenibacillus sp. L3-i20]|uniref:hypothetical protein n=1 Tax=Paenibacillus sp. L3-i20 TaxID=2905833 RepID=UPI001EDE03F2|nr:hypothetical protein [Paenibacillus sp. L3-i20]GKU79881.1 hypothetical protein L3i20_v242780 [Paenibacillus sp. L3-i20]